MPGDDMIELMVKAAVSDAFHQRGLPADKEVVLASGDESYRFMGVDLRQVMRAAVAAIEDDGWSIVRSRRPPAGGTHGKAAPAVPLD